MVNPVRARTKLLVIGIDAANPSLIRSLAAEGALPNLAGLMRRGCVAKLSGVAGFFTGATWPSLITGSDPAQHGIHYIAQLVPGTYRFTRPHEGSYIAAPAFWEALSQRGRRLAILDVPLARLDRRINGIQTVEWAAHDSLFGFQTTPAPLAAEILARHGRHPVLSDCDRIGRRPEDYRAFVATLIEGVAAKRRLTADLLARGPWDLLMQVFTETHCVGHQCWHLHDGRHPNHDPTVFASTAGPLRQVYQAVDEALGELIAAAGAPAVMVVVSHGMAHTIGSHRLLPETLSRLGFSRPVPRRLRPRDVAHAIARRLPAPADRMVGRWLDRPGRPGHFTLPEIGVDTRSSRCFVVPNGLAVSGIRLNLAGREPHGTVRPGPEAAALCDELEDALLAIRDEDTQAALVRRVLRTSDVYAGPKLDCLPDILVEWEDSGTVGTAVPGDRPASLIRATSNRTGPMQVINDYPRTGEHRGEGLLIAAGPGVLPGAELTASIFDVAPSITAAFGIDLPGARGRPVPQLMPSIE